MNSWPPRHSSVVSYMPLGSPAPQARGDSRSRNSFQRKNTSRSYLRWPDQPSFKSAYPSTLHVHCLHCLPRLPHLSFLPCRPFLPCLFCLSCLACLPPVYPAYPGSRVWGLWFSVQSLRCMSPEFEFQVQSLGFRVQGSGVGFRVVWCEE